MKKKTWSQAGRNSSKTKIHSMLNRRVLFTFYKMVQILVAGWSQKFLENNFKIKTKKAFAFSFLAIFLSFLIFAFGSVYLFQSDFTKSDNFKDSRITYVDNEVKYFSNIYLENSLKFSFYNSINNLLEKKSNLILINNNYSKLNSLIYESITNGSLNFVPQKNLENKTINYFVKIFSDSFNKNYKGNFTFKIVKLNIFQKNTYELSLQILGTFNVTTKDNIGKWNFKKEMFVSIPIYGLKDPQFFLLENLNISIRPVDLYAANTNWTAKLLNETLIQNYSVVYLDPTYKYSLGNNFLAELLNNSKSSYKDVFGFYSFDYDNEKGEIYDTAQYSKNIKYYGNTKLLMNLDEGLAKDISSYNNSGILMGAINCSISGISKRGCFFDGVNDYINISNPNNLNFTDNFSISLWIKTDDKSLSPKRIIRNYNYDLFLFSQKIGFILNENQTSQIFTTNISDNTWHFITSTYSNNISKLYLDGFLVNTINYNLLPNSSINDFIIGSNLGQNEFFNGSIDEIGIYSKGLSLNEITNLYSNQKAEFIDYKNSLFGKSIFLDGIDDKINISYSPKISLKNYSIEFWIKPNSNKSNSILNFKNSTGIIRFFLNNLNKLEIDNLPLNSGNLYSDYDINKWNHFVFVSNQSQINLFRNSKLVDSKNLNFPFSNIENLIIAGNNTNFFNGEIDEIKIYNYSLTKNEVEQNYYNYDSFAKGCCNYLTLINPNKLGYNSNFYSKNISYSSKVFYDFYRRGGILKPKKYNLTLLNITNITSINPSLNYFHFLADACMLSAYSIDNYNLGINGWDYYKKNGIYNLSCTNLIKAGFY